MLPLLGHCQCLMYHFTRVSNQTSSVPGNQNNKICRHLPATEGEAKVFGSQGCLLSEVFIFIGAAQLLRFAVREKTLWARGICLH